MSKSANMKKLVRTLQQHAAMGRDDLKTLSDHVLRARREVQDVEQRESKGEPYPPEVLFSKLERALRNLQTAMFQLEAYTHEIDRAIH